MEDVKAILVTGATGSIGVKLRLHFSEHPRVRLRLLCLNTAKDHKVTTADLSTYNEEWARQFEGVDAVVHLAGAAFPDSSWDLVQRLNIDLSMNVLRAAERSPGVRFVYASSNWVVAGYRFGTERLTTTIAPRPVNAYGSSKACVESAGRDWAARTGNSFLALRIGYCQHAAGNVPGPHMENGLWGQQMWVSDRDLCQAIEKAALAPAETYAVLNVMSDNPGMRWDLSETRRVIGYEPQDGHVARTTPEIARTEGIARAAIPLIEGLESLSRKW